MFKEWCNFSLRIVKGVAKYNAFLIYIGKNINIRFLGPL